MKGIIEQAQKPASGICASLIGVITLLFGASGVFGELRAALKIRCGTLNPEARAELLEHPERGMIALRTSQLFHFPNSFAVHFAPTFCHADCDCRLRSRLLERLGLC